MQTEFIYSNFEIQDGLKTINRFVIWDFDDIDCGSKFMRQVCIISVKDLSVLIARSELFADKFHLSYDPGFYDCMEKWIVQKATANKEN